jgi:hypothetical protein
MDSEGDGLSETTFENSILGLLVLLGQSKDKKFGLLLGPVGSLRKIL